MTTATIRIPEKKKNLLKAVASLENRKMSDVIVQLIDEYLDRHRESLELLDVPGLAGSLSGAARDIHQGKGITIARARKEMDG